MSQQLKSHPLGKLHTQDKSYIHSVRLQQTKDRNQGAGGAAPPEQATTASPLSPLQQIGQFTHGVVHKLKNQLLFSLCPSFLPSFLPSSLPAHTQRNKGRLVPKTNHPRNNSTNLSANTSFHSSAAAQDNKYTQDDSKNNPMKIFTRCTKTLYRSIDVCWC